MSLKEKMDEALAEREKMFRDTGDEWDYGVEQCQKKEIELLLNNEEETIQYLLNDCTESDFSWLSEVFDDVAERNHSMVFIDTLYKLLDKYPDESKKYNVESFVRTAKCAVENYNAKYK